MNIGKLFFQHVSTNKKHNFKSSYALKPQLNVIKSKFNNKLRQSQELYSVLLLLAYNAIPPQYGTIPFLNELFIIASTLLKFRTRT